jgi:hypothetical protein
MPLKIETMNKNINGRVLKIFAILIGSFITNVGSLFSQDSLSSKGYSFSLSLKVIKNNDGTRIYTSKLTGEGEKGTFPVYQADISYYNEADGGKELIGSEKTNKDGIATLTAGKGTKYQKDKAGIITVKSVFIDPEKVPMAEASIKFQDLNLSINLTEKDSVHTILIDASSLGANDEQLPLKETTANIYIQGLYSKLKIGDCFIDNGQGEFKFPDNIPGDQNGNTNIFVRIEENENFGDVEKTGTAKWGQHRTGFVEPTRSLWSSGAPLWMIITLTILLVGVWSHYLYAIVQLVKIRIEGKKLDRELKKQ